MDWNNTEIRGEKSQRENFSGTSCIAVCCFASLCTGHFHTKNKMLSKHNAGVTYINPNQSSQKPLVLCRFLLSSIDPFSSSQAEYSAYAIRFINDRTTALVKLENTWKHDSTKDEKRDSLKFRDWTLKPKRSRDQRNKEIH